MKKIFKPTLLLMALLAIGRLGFAQDTLNFDNKSFNLNIKDLDLNMKSLNLAMNDLNKSLKSSLKDLDKGLSVIVPEISENFKELGKNLSINLDDVVVEKMVESGDIEEKVKTYSKSYPADANDKLEINNKYGRVIVNTWNKNEFKVDIQIKADARDEEIAQKLIDAISISDSKNGDLVSFRTNFGGNNGNGSIWNLFNTRNNNHKVEVNYTIYMPSKNALSVNNSYGATELPDLEGKVSVNVSYGSLSAKALTHAANTIKVSYGSADIESLNSSQLDVDYGSLELGSVDKLTSDISYSSVKIGRIKSSGNINAHYAGGIQIDELDRNFTNLSINSSYSGIKVGLNNAASADFDVTVHYGGFDYSDLPVDITKKTPPDSEKGFHPTQNYKGHVGKGNTDKMISIRSSYGGVKFE
jgi:hypothetical protein